MRTGPVFLLVLVALAPIGASQVTVHLACQEWVPEMGPIDTSCEAPIHPGARSNACTLNWVVTDGTQLYIGAAKHCVGAIGQDLWVEGVDHAVGDLVFRGPRNDSAFFQIRAADHHLVTGTLEGWGGPHTGPTGVANRNPYTGETVLYYGHGYFTDGVEPARMRAGTALYGWPPGSLFLFAGQVSGGDSGSPVMLATGEAVGLISAAVFPLNLVPAEHPDVPGPTVVFGVQLQPELDELAKQIGKPVVIVKGRPMLKVA